MTSVGTITARVDTSQGTPSRDERPQPGRPRASHATLLTAAQVCRGLFRLLFLVVTARVLGPETFGVYALLLATVEMIAVASGTGYTDYLTREAATDDRLGWGLAEQLAGLRCACTVPLVAVGLGILWLLHYRHAVVVAAAWFSVTLLFRAASEAVQGVLRGTHRYWAFLQVELALGCGLVAGTVLLLVRGGGLTVVVGTEIAAAISAALLAVFLTIRLRPRTRSYLPLRKLIKSSVIFNIYAFVGNLYDRVDVLILSKLAGDYATGIYSAAYRPLAAIQLLPYGILYSLLPSLSRSQRDDSDWNRLRKALGLLLSAALFIVLATFAFADLTVTVLLGPKFSEAAIALKILICAVVFRFLNYALNIALLALRQERIFVLTSIICLGVNVGGNLLLIPRFHWRAAALLTVVTEVVLFIQNMYWVRRTLGMFLLPGAVGRKLLGFAACLGGCVLSWHSHFPLLTNVGCLGAFGLYIYYMGLRQELETWPR
jgi:O-antigen/teichoic acid export membrane protein